jgi:hypothetical protein
MSSKYDSSTIIDLRLTVCLVVIKSIDVSEYSSGTVIPDGALAGISFDTPVSVIGIMFS